jgi:nitroreductase
MDRKQSLFSAMISLARIIKGRPRISPALDGNAMLQTILNRRSVRAFQARSIPEEVFSAIIEAGRLAPSTVNLQTWSFAIFSPETWQQSFSHKIPFGGNRAVIIIADTYRAKQVLNVFPDCPLLEHTVAVMNASLAAMNMNLAAEAMGVSSVMLSETGRTGLLDANYIRTKLNLPAGAVPLMTIVFGYARGAPPPMPPRLPVTQIVFEGEYPSTDRLVMESWLDQMVAGYNISHPGSSFAKQLEVYQRKISQAESDLKEIVFGKNGDID